MTKSKSAPIIDPKSTYRVTMAETVERKSGDLKRGARVEMSGAYLEKVKDKVASYEPV